MVVHLVEDLVHLVEDLVVEGSLAEGTVAEVDREVARRLGRAGTLQQHRSWVLGSCCSREAQLEVVRKGCRNQQQWGGG